MFDFDGERIVLARHTSAGGEIQLQQRRLADGRTAFELIVDGVFLMASYNQASERALARRTLAGLAAESGAGWRLLVGGLGMGFTLQEALSHPGVAQVEVVELDPYVVEWNRRYFAPLNDRAVEDPRVTVIQQDLQTVLYAAPPAQYHAILLDVDNGPSWLAHDRNAGLYTAEALARWATLLRPEGRLAVWSAQAEPEFLKRLQAVFGHAEEIPVMAEDSRREPVEHFIYRAHKLGVTASD